MSDDIFEQAREQYEAEERDRREWIEGVRRRLGLVAEVHRCHVWRGLWGWMWFCRRPGCNRVWHDCPSQPDAFAAASAHARSFMPEPPEETAVTELDLLAFDALWTGIRAQQDAIAAALPGRMEAVAEKINEYLGGLPGGMRFEWGIPAFSPDRLLGARHDTPDMTGPVTGFEPLPEADPAPSPLRWYYGPTFTDPDPGKMWCYGCFGEVMVFDGVYVCGGCGKQSGES